jgi:hypothetical protein
MAGSEGENPIGQVAATLPVGDFGTEGTLPAGEPGHGSSTQVGSVHVSSALQVAVPVVEYPVSQSTAILLPVGDVRTEGIVASAFCPWHGSSTQVGNIQVSSSLQVAVPDGEYPTGQVTAMSTPVGDFGTDGSVPFDFTAGQGSSMQVGIVQVSSALQVAVPDGEYPTSHVTTMPLPVGDVGAYGWVSFVVAGQGSSLHLVSFPDASSPSPVKLTR